MCDRTFTKWIVAASAAVILSVNCLPAQELPTSDDSFAIEPPLLIPLGERESSPEDSREESPADVGKLEQQLLRAKKSAVSVERLVKMGVLAKTEAEQRALRAIRLEAGLANAQAAAAKEQVTLQQARIAAGQASQAELDAALTTQARANATAEAATEKYHKAQLDAAALNLRRQRQLLAQGSARKSDVARAEEKLAILQRGDEE